MQRNWIFFIIDFTIQGLAQECSGLLLFESCFGFKNKILQSALNIQVQEANNIKHNSRGVQKRERERESNKTTRRETSLDRKP